MQRLSLIKNQLSSSEVPLTPPVFSKVTYETNSEGTVAIINLSSPTDLNSLTKELKKDIINALGYAQASTKVKVVLILSTVDKAFCAGANIKEFTSCTMESQMTNDVFEDITVVLGNFRKPLIAGVNGIALGGGMELALAADIIICSEEARFGLPELKLGLIPGLGGTQRLTKIVGKVNASRYIFTSDFITAADAKIMGLVSDVYKKENLRTEAINLANRIAAEKSLYTLVTAKTAIKAADEMGITQGIDYERQVFNRLFNTKASKEGVDAFLQKRKPNFKDI